VHGASDYPRTVLVCLLVGHPLAQQDPELFSVICPGNDRFIGRDEWIKRAIEASKIFGVGNVSPNFVAGIKMANCNGFDMGFENPKDAV
jgi:hypothetical protein